MFGLKANGLTLHCRSDGTDDAPALVFSNSLGTDLRIWDRMLTYLPTGLRLIRYDKRGHGLSDGRGDVFGMTDHIADIEALLDHLNISNALICGLSVGGMIAQGLAAKRPDLVRGLVLMDTAAKIGDAAMWNARIEAIRSDGITASSDMILEKWFTARFRAEAPDFPVWRNMLCRTTLDGYVGTCAAIRDTDLSDSTRKLTVPTLALVGAEDGATPPELVRGTADMIAGARFEIIAGAGHIPCIEQPRFLGTLIGGFLKEIGHV